MRKNTLSSGKARGTLKSCCLRIQQQALSKTLVLALVLVTGFTYAQNPRIENGVAIYHSNKNIGQKFLVPDSWDKILIKENVTITGSFYMPNRTRPIEIAGESRTTSIIKGTGNGMHHQGNREARQFSAIRCDKSPNVYIHDLRSLNPDKFHISAGFGKVTVERCDIIDNRGQHTTDGIHGGQQQVTVKDCYIDTHDDALYVSECVLVENTTIVHNHNGSPFQVSWGISNLQGYACTIRNCKVIDASTKNSDYNQGVVSWAGRNGNGNYDITLNFEGTFERQTRAGANTSHMYQIGRKSGGINNCTIKVNGLCQWQNSQKIYGNTNSKVIIGDCDSGDNNDGGGCDMNVSATKTNVTCNNQGSITFSVSDYGTRTGIVYKVGNGSYSATQSTSDTYTVNNLNAGNYALFAQWGNGDCPNTAIGSVSIADNCDAGNDGVTDITDLSLTAQSCTSVKLTWSDINGEDAYRVRRKKVGDATYNNLTDVPAGTTTYTDATAQANTAYEYMVRPVQNGTAVALSNTPTITTSTCDDGGNDDGGNNNGGDCTPWYNNSGVWKGKGRIAISSDGNEHDKDDWAATPMSLALLAAKGLQDQLTLYTYSDHVWGSNHDHSDARQQMRESALEGANQFGFDNTNFMEAVADPNAAYNAMAAEINASSANNPLFIIAAGPMHVVGQGLDRAQQNKLQYVTVISHSNWNNRHSDNPNNWENHNGWTWDEMVDEFQSKGVTFDRITDQNGGNGYDGLRAAKSKYSWILNNGARNNSLYKAGSWDWLYERQEAAQKGSDFDPSDAGMIVYLLTGIEETDPSDARDIMATPVAPCSGDDNNDDGGNNNDCEGYAEVDGVVMMEAENTDSPLGEWIVKTDNPGFTGSGHLEFTGNGINGGPATSPLTYTFTVSSEGYYRLHMRVRKRLEGAEPDKSNDGYVKLAGDFDAGQNAGNNHNDDAPESMLRQNTKFFGGPANGWGWASKLDAGGHNNKRNPIYYLKAGETYTLTLSGRSIRWNVDRIVFAKLSVANNVAFAVTEETGCSDDNNDGGGNDCDINVATSKINVTCEENGSITLSVTDFGGRTFIKYKVGNAAYTSNVATTDSYTASNLSAGTYPILAEWGNGDCANTSVGAVTVGGGCNDTDNDDIPDNEDECPNDPTNTCNNPDVQSPQDVSLEKIDCETVLISWSDIDAGEEAYRVRRKVEGEATYTNIGDVGPNVTSFLDETAEENTTYVYMVRGMYSGVAQGVSNTPSITTDECVVTSVDSDGDGTLDDVDQCDNDPNKIVPGDCGCSVPETTCNPTNELNIHLHPNPFENELRVTFSTTVDVQSVQLVNMMGDAINVDVQILSANQIFINTSSVPGGQYQLQIVTTQGVANETVMKLN